jgi:hypothetical protein
MLLDHRIAAAVLSVIAMAIRLASSLVDFLGRHRE